MLLPRLREVREGAFLTQAMLADKSGISVGQISRLEQGHYPARMSTVWKLAEALGVEPGRLTPPTASEPA